MTEIFSNTKFVLIVLTVFSITALAMAFASEAFLGLEPCILCIYQRWPYAVVTLFGVIGLAMPILRRPIIALNGLAFLANSAIAVYHTGVEQKWWHSAIEACGVPPGFLDAEPQSILENIMSAPTANCAEIPWTDPLLGLSMANYNALICFALFMICVVSFVMLRPPIKLNPAIKPRTMIE